MTPEVFAADCFFKLLHQGRTSSNVIGCAYRGPDGAACAIGMYLDDEQYEPHFDANGASFEDLQESDVELPSALRCVITMNGRVMPLGSALQTIHDVTEGERDFEQCIRDDFAALFRENEWDLRLLDPEYIKEYGEEMPMCSDCGRRAELPTAYRPGQVWINHCVCGKDEHFQEAQ